MPFEQNEDGDQSFTDVFIVTDFNECNLKNLFEMVKGDTFTLEHALTICYNILCAVAFLHSANIWHRDLQPETLLITSNCNVLIGDFGTARSRPLGQNAVSRGSTSPNQAVR